MLAGCKSEFSWRLNRFGLPVEGGLSFLCPKLARKVHYQGLGEPPEPRKVNSRPRNSLFLAIVVTSFVLLACTPAVDGQSANAASVGRAQNYTISTRQLRIPAKAQAAFHLGFECMVKGDAAKSLPHFRRAIEEFPDYYEAYYDQGVAQMRLDKKDAALQSFQKALDLSDGHFARAYFGYGLVLEQQGRLKDAEPIIRQGLQEDSTLSEGYAVLSAVLFDENRLDEAEEAARKALGMPDPSARNALITLAFIYLKKGEYRSAVEELESYLRAVRSGQFKENAAFVKFIEGKLSDAKEKSNLTAKHEQSSLSEQMWHQVTD